MARYNTLSDEQIRCIRLNLKRFRREQGLLMGREFTQEDLADAADIKLDTLSKWEHGQRHPKLAALYGLAQVFGRPIDHFFMRDPPPPEPSHQRSWFVRVKVIGEAPAGVRAAIESAVKKFPARSGSTSRADRSGSSRQKSRTNGRSRR